MAKAGGEQKRLDGGRRWKEVDARDVIAEEMSVVWNCRVAFSVGPTCKKSVLGKWLSSAGRPLSRLVG